MDNFRINRLDFTKMVDKHLQGYPQMKYFKPIFMHPDDKLSRRVNKEKDARDNSINIQGKIDGIVAHVHSQLKERRPPQYPKLFSKEPKTAMKATRNASKQTAKVPLEGRSKLCAALPEQRVNKNANITTSIHTKKQCVIIDNPAHRKFSIPRLKALCHQQEQKRLHCNIPPPKHVNNFVNQKRMAEIEQQNKIFSSMLEDQKQLQCDRQSIAQEIPNMRNLLNSIRGRLDSSVKKLAENKTYVDRNSSNAPKKLKTNKRSMSINRGLKKKTLV